MPDYFELKFTGVLAPNNKISARTLAHSLQYMQRAIDKMVIHEKRGVLRKYAALRSTEYAEADLIVQQFEAGSIRIPLINDATDWLGRKLNELLYDQYQRAAHQIAQEYRPLNEQIPAARERAVHKEGHGNTQRDLIADEQAREMEYLKAAVLQDINNLISPLRSGAITDTETIDIVVASGHGAQNYVFNKNVSTRFSKSVTAKTLGPETLYTGRLTGLSEARAGRFRYRGQFLSAITRQEMALMIATEAEKDELRPHNLSGEDITFWASPIATCGEFDEVRGDIVFLGFHRE